MLPNLFIKRSDYSFKSNMRSNIWLPLIIFKVIWYLFEKKRLSNTIGIRFIILRMLSYLK